MLPGFEWDPVKAEENLRKHGVSFPEAASAFADGLSVAKADEEHSMHENRYVLTGLSVRQRLVVVAYTERGDAIPVISARLATPKEKRAYEH